MTVSRSFTHCVGFVAYICAVTNSNTVFNAWWWWVDSLRKSNCTSLCGLCIKPPVSYLQMRTCLRPKERKGRETLTMRTTMKMMNELPQRPPQTPLTLTRTPFSPCVTLPIGRLQGCVPFLTLVSPSALLSASLPQTRWPPLTQPDDFR